MANEYSRIFLGGLMNFGCGHATMSLDPRDNVPYSEKEIYFFKGFDIGEVAHFDSEQWKKVTDVSYRIVSAEHLINREYAKVYDLSGNILHIIIEGITQDNIGHHLLLKPGKSSEKYELVRDITMMYNRYVMYIARRQAWDNGKTS